MLPYRWRGKLVKNIVIFCDGTNQRYQRHNTNIVKLYQSVERDKTQTAFYDPGVGTFSILGRTLARKAGMALGLAFGAGVQHNIEDAYRFLMDHFEDADKVFLFGFSRGAFTARALAGMLYKCGLLEPGNENLIPYASEIYNKRDNEEIAQGFKQTFSRECKPHLIGVWDTVAAMGWVWGRKFFDAKLNPDVAFGYQVAAVDEKRPPFAISLWEESQKVSNQVIEQVWFPGFHSDVGGSHPDPGISDLTLEWMLRKAQNQGLRLRPGVLEQLSPNPAGATKPSHGGLFRLWRPQERTIPRGAKIHQSVFARMSDSEIEYRPPNLPEQYMEVAS